MKEIRRVGGPWVDARSGRRRVEVVYADGTRKGTLLSRHMMEMHLGRDLTKDETVDHIDNDKTNDTIENLQILSLADNIRKSSRPMVMVTFTCPVCGEEATKQEALVRANRDKGHSGPYCGQRCAGIATHPRTKPVNPNLGSRGPYGQPSTHGEKLHYRRGCRCPACKEAMKVYNAKRAERATKRAA